MNERAMRRRALKAQYEKFCRAWRDEKTYQRVYVGSGKSLPDGVEQLGRKPTFRMWLTALENKRLAERSAPPQKAVEVGDPVWEE
jgi:hypothetical protein